MMAEAVARYLAAQGQGTVDTDLFWGWMPDKPANAVSCYDESAPVDDISTGLAIDTVGVQVWVRAENYGGARTKAWAIHKILSGARGELYAGFPEAIVIGVNTPPVSIGRDEDGRSEWSAHYEVTFQSAGDSWRQ